MTVIDDFGAKLAERREKKAAYFEKMDRASECFRLLAPAIIAMFDLGADSQTIINVLKVSIDELHNSEALPTP